MLMYTICFLKRFMVPSKNVYDIRFTNNDQIPYFILGLLHIITRTSIVTGVIGSGRIVWPYVRHGGSFRFRRITSIPPKPFAKPNAFSLVENITYIKANARSPGNQRACWFPRPAVVLHKSIQIPWSQAKRTACCCLP